MNKKKQTHEFLEFFKTNATAILGILFALLNLWLAFKLAPLSDSIKTNANAIKANAIEINRLNEDYVVLKVEIKDSLVYLRDRVDKIHDILLNLN